MRAFFVSYLKKTYHILILFLVFGLIFYIIFALSGLDMNYYNLGMEIMLVFFMVYLVIIAIRHKNTMSLLLQVENLKLEKNEMRNKMMRDRDDLRDYYSVWVHQMKTPITVAKLLVDEIGDESTNLKNDLKKELLQIEDYTNMAMTYIKISSRETDMDLTRVYLDDIIRNVLKKYSLIFISNHTSIEFEPTYSYVISDYSWLSILIEQLVSNAAKYTENGKVLFEFHEDKNSLEIRDTGIGIRSEDLPKIFDRGYSGFNGRLNQKSSGLGLFLVTSIAKKLSVGIRVESKIGDGSSFFVDFPSEVRFGVLD